MGIDWPESLVPPDVTLALGDPETMFMGAHRAWELHNADRLTEHRSGALDKLDAAFNTKRARPTAGRCSENGPSRRQRLFSPAEAVPWRPHQ